MGTYTQLYVADYPTLSTKSYVDSVVMTIFRETDKRVFERRVSERNQYTWGHLEDKGEIEVVHEYSNTVDNIIQRLNVMGFSLNFIERDFDKGKYEEIERLNDYIEDNLHTILNEEYSARKKLLENSTFKDWLIAFKEIYDRKLSEQILENKLPTEESALIHYILGPNDGDEPYYRFPCSDIRSFLRAFLEVVPKDGLVAQDITDLVDGGYYGENEKVCEISVQELTGDYPINEKIIVLAEGSTDINVLEKSLKLLYPHLSEYYSFMDFGLSNAQGSAGGLVNTIKAFVGSGISNRVIAIFDNDSAGFDAIRGLNKTSIPSNIRILNYPNIEIAKSYPTLGPSGISKLDINGLACSIEVYFGEDILKFNGELSLIQWKGYIDGVKKYQGEIMNKIKLQELFNEKLSKCTVDQKLIDKTDWSGIKLILSEIFQAFQ